MHLTQDPHVETTHKTRYHQKPSSGAVRRRYGTARWFAARRTPLSRLTRRTRSQLESSTKPVRDSHTCDNTPSTHSFMCIDKVWCHFQHDNASSAPVGGAWRRHRDRSCLPRADTNNGPYQHRGDMGGGEDRNRHARHTS